MEIQEIKQRLRIIAVLQHYNLKPDRNNQIECPQIIVACRNSRYQNNKAVGRNIHYVQLKTVA